MKIITHRGLDPAKKNYFVESSLEAFTDQLSRGYGLEFDLQITKDNKIVIIHDHNLKRISNGKDERRISEIDADEILAMDFNGCHIASLDKLIYLINEKQSPNSISAIHLKHHYQNKKYLDIILNYLKNVYADKFIIFDVTIETAKYLKKHNSKLHLASSVSHPFDIKRYNNVVGGTLLEINDVLNNRELFDWVWLDEWDLIDENGSTKKLYTDETFKILKSKGIKIALVTPELHATSPNLLGGERHVDAETKEKLFDRMKEIVNLRPDAVCTDYPDQVKQLLYPLV
ncbi:MAG: glycerophosphodiester phosphodiesterase family protein [Sulfurovaceae bacterium]|nr:glycerophosphodiester phosphodiesterase family protein [Sulfurovaceae bacterium]